MKKTFYTAQTHGTSALKTPAATLRPRDQRIIEFPVSRPAEDFYQTDYSRIARAHHASFIQRCVARVLALLQKSPSLHDLLTGNLKGQSFGSFSRTSIVLASFIYSAIAIGALFIAI